jgi:dihydrofolate reductase
MMAGYWPNSTENDPVITEKMNNLPKLVFSKTLSSVDWNNSRLANGNAIDEISRLKKSIRDPGKHLVIFGSGKLISSLANLGLIDEYRVILNPVILGSGNPMFKGINYPQKLKLLKANTLSSGVVILYYEVNMG